MIERYQSQGIARLWSDDEKLSRWTRIEIAACRQWFERGQIPKPEWQAIAAAHAPSRERVEALEQETQHDVVAFVWALGEIVGEPARRHLHRGLTSSDVVDTALALALVESVGVLEVSAALLLQSLAALALRHRSTECIGRTHGMHAEPMVFGLKVASWHQELRRNLDRLARARTEIGYGKISGAVGTYSQSDPKLEALVLAELGLLVEPVSTQVVPRDRHAFVLQTLALLGSGLERMATEIRALQRTELGEIQEPFHKGQAGSSAMPHKQNPIVCERVCGMARLLRSYSLAALENVALWHERDISHSSVERVVLPDAFHIAHTMLLLLHEVIEGLTVNETRMRDNVTLLGGVAASQAVLGALLAHGADRQEAYRAVQTAAARAMEGKASFVEAIATSEVGRQVDRSVLQAALDARCAPNVVDHIYQRAGLI